MIMRHYTVTLAVSMLGKIDVCQAVAFRHQASAPVITCYCTVTLAVSMLLLSCSGGQDMRQAVADRVVKKALEIRLGKNARAQVSKNRIVIDKDGRRYIVTSREKSPEKSGLEDKLPAIPGGKVVSAIYGIGEETYALSVDRGLEEVEKFYAETLPEAGFARVSVLEGTGQFYGKWTNTKSGAGLSVYAFSDKGKSRVFLVRRPTATPG